MTSSAVIGIIEFGSTARGDGDQYSDRDIFAVVDDVDADTLDILRARIAEEYNTSASSVACYSTSSFDQMIAHGSLFIWHLRLEGRIISDPDDVFLEAFASLAPYKSFATDLAQFKEIYADAREAYGDSGLLDSFEKHVLFIVVRNVCMLLTTHCGQPTFGRRTVIPTARQLYAGLPLSATVADALEGGHLIYMRNVSLDAGQPDGPDPERIIGEVGALLDFASEALP
ncbi:MAG: nucleotidyltransferase domain-containing protein [Bryobacteraceae bacterium]